MEAGAVELALAVAEAADGLAEPPPMGELLFRPASLAPRFFPFLAAETGVDAPMGCGGCWIVAKLAVWIAVALGGGCVV